MKLPLKLLLSLTLIFLVTQVNAQQVQTPEYQLTQIGLDREIALTYNLQCQFVSNIPIFYNFKNKTYLAMNITCLHIVPEGNMYSFYRRSILAGDKSLVVKYPLAEFKDCIIANDDDNICVNRVIMNWKASLNGWKKAQRQRMYNYQSVTQDTETRDLLINPNIGL